MRMHEVLHHCFVYKAKEGRHMILEYRNKNIKA